jgi:hypothetical protein
MIDIHSGHPVIDRYLDEGYEKVRGMSSRFAAAICGHIVRRQTELGIQGDIAEVGTFEGRFFIALALGLAEGENAVGFDTFDWPNERVLDRFLAHCERNGLAKDRFVAWKANTRDITPAMLRAKLKTGAVRFFHIDGEHADKSLTIDLELAHQVMHPKGVIALDDMLHPAYPELFSTAVAYLKRHTEMRALAIVDREDIVAAAKLLICRRDALELYENDLMQSFKKFHFEMGGDVLDELTVVLTPKPRLAEVGWDE